MSLDKSDDGVSYTYLPDLSTLEDLELACLDNIYYAV